MESWRWRCWHFESLNIIYFVQELFLKFTKRISKSALWLIHAKHWRSQADKQHPWTQIPKPQPTNLQSIKCRTSLWFCWRGEKFIDFLAVTKATKLHENFHYKKLPGNGKKGVEIYINYIRFHYKWHLGIAWERLAANYINKKKYPASEYVKYFKDV